MFKACELLPNWGSSIREAIDKALTVAAIIHAPVSMKFNGISLIIREGDTAEDLYARYTFAMGGKQ